MINALEQLTGETVGDSRQGAVFSPCRDYRYLLWRRLSRSHKAMLFILLNPSTADEQQDDPTIRRCIGFARTWGIGRLFVANIFAYRDTYPAGMKQRADPIGPLNKTYILWAAQQIQTTATARYQPLIVCAWGNHGEHLQQGRAVRDWLQQERLQASYLRQTQSGHPTHPLYLPAHLKPQPL